MPDAEKALATEPEILITRDGRPVARLLPLAEENVPRKTFDPEEQRSWMGEFRGQGVVFDSLTGLLEDREDRPLP